ncbi:MAG: adhesin [Candidatus Electrothrix sp. ATG2]|nr:adhesin [Candidatus Electrothrix sp. ATG2]
MLEVTEAAASNVKEYLKQQNIDTAVRITMMSGGCSGPALGLALDEAKEDDLTFEQDGVNFLVEKGLAETCGTITVDYLESSSGCGCSGGGFNVTSEKPLAGAGDGCGCSCTSGSCG